MLGKRTTNTYIVRRFAAEEIGRIDRRVNGNEERREKSSSNTNNKENGTSTVGEISDEDEERFGAKLPTRWNEVASTSAAEFSTAPGDSRSPSA